MLCNVINTRGSHQHHAHAGTDLPDGEQLNRIGHARGGKGIL